MSARSSVKAPFANASSPLTKTWSDARRVGVRRGHRAALGDRVGVEDRHVRPGRRARACRGPAARPARPASPVSRRTPSSRLEDAALADDPSAGRTRPTCRRRGIAGPASGPSGASVVASDSGEQVRDANVRSRSSWVWTRPTNSTFGASSPASSRMSIIASSGCWPRSRPIVAKSLPTSSGDARGFEQGQPVPLAQQPELVDRLRGTRGSERAPRGSRSWRSSSSVPTADADGGNIVVSLVMPWKPGVLVAGDVHAGGARAIDPLEDVRRARQSGAPRRGAMCEIWSGDPGPSRRCRTPRRTPRRRGSRGRACGTRRAAEAAARPPRARISSSVVAARPERVLEPGRQPERAVVDRPVELVDHRPLLARRGRAAAIVPEDRDPERVVARQRRDVHAPGAPPRPPRGTPPNVVQSASRARRV